jgi:hypothetical protein
MDSPELSFESHSDRISESSSSVIETGEGILVSNGIGNLPLLIPSPLPMARVSLRTGNSLGAGISIPCSSGPGKSILVAEPFELGGKGVASGTTERLDALCKRSVSGAVEILEPVCEGSISKAVDPCESLCRSFISRPELLGPSGNEFVDERLEFEGEEYASGASSALAVRSGSVYEPIASGMPSWRARSTCMVFLSSASNSSCLSSPGLDAGASTVALERNLLTAFIVVTASPSSSLVCLIWLRRLWM